MYEHVLRMISTTCRQTMSMILVTGVTCLEIPFEKKTKPFANFVVVIII
jgi:hypothetical protein